MSFKPKLKSLWPSWNIIKFLLGINLISCSWCGNTWFLQLFLWWWGVLYDQYHCSLCFIISLEIMDITAWASYTPSAPICVCICVKTTTITGYALAIILRQNIIRKKMLLNTLSLYPGIIYKRSWNNQNWGS